MANNHLVRYLAIPAIGAAFWCFRLSATPTTSGVWSVEAAVKGGLVWAGSMLVYLAHQWMHKGDSR